MFCFFGVAKYVRFLIFASMFAVSYAISSLSLANVAWFTLFVSAPYVITDVMPMFKFRLILDPEFWSKFWRCVRDANLEPFWFCFYRSFQLLRKNLSVFSCIGKIDLSDFFFSVVGFFIGILVCFVIPNFRLLLMFGYFLFDDGLLLALLDSR